MLSGLLFNVNLLSDAMKLYEISPKWRGLINKFDLFGGGRGSKFTKKKVVTSFVNSRRNSVKLPLEPLHFLGVRV